MNNMNETRQFEVIKPFKYNGKMYTKDDVWVPDGGLYDSKIIEQEKFVLPLNKREDRREQNIRRATKLFAKAHPSGLGDKIMGLLHGAGYDDPEKIGGASDDELLAIKGIGPATLKNIREEYSV